MDVEKVYGNIVKNIQAYFKENKKSKAVIGLSGGVDSSLSAMLAVKALGKQNVTGLIMPQKGLSLKTNVDDAIRLAEKLEIRWYIVPINEYIASYSNLPWKGSKLAGMNAKARVRAALLYHFANTHNAIVIGTSNKTEIVLGYFTKYGDGAVDIEVIGELYKTEVYKLARFLQLPEAILSKPPSAELFHGHTDESELGGTYEEIDKILRQIEKEYPGISGIKRMQTSKANPGLFRRILGLIQANQHKRRVPPVMASGKLPEKSAKTGIFIGRFQPFHKGHAGVVRRALEECDAVIIGVGSSQHKGTSKNPYSFEERKHIIEKTLQDEVILDRYQIVAIPDINNDALWVDHVEKICGKASIVYSGNPRTIRLFKAKGYQVARIKRELRISATEIRSRLKGNNSIDGLISKAAEQHIKG